MKQQTDTVSASQAEFTITHMDGVDSSNVQVYFTEGAPTDAGNFRSLSITPTLVSID